MNWLTRGLLSLMVLVLSQVGHADSMLMMRMPMRAETAFAYASSSVEEHGYTIAHVQKCDGGMQEFGFKTDFYRVIFFGKLEQVRAIVKQHPEMASYLPLKLAVIAEKDETLLTILNPEALAPYFNDPDLRIQLGRWHSDLLSIFADLRRLTDEHQAAK